MGVDHNDLSCVARELAAREPIFHKPEFGTSREDFDRLMAKDYWEIGASGQKYSREFVLSAGRHCGSTLPRDGKSCTIKARSFRARRRLSSIHKENASWPST